MKKCFLQTSPRTLALIFLHLFMLLGVGLVTFRFGYTGKKTFLFFIWNLFLAYIPFLITSLLYWKEKLKENAISFYSLFSLWLLFLPNAPYLLTDLKHLRPAPTFLFWYDLFVDELHRGKGIAKQLIEISKDLCKLTNSCGLMLETAKTNIVGNELYPNVGFCLDKAHNYYFWDNN